MWNSSKEIFKLLQTGKCAAHTIEVLVNILETKESVERTSEAAKRETVAAFAQRSLYEVPIHS